jgi:hypothetical protein
VQEEARNQYNRTASGDTPSSRDIMESGMIAMPYIKEILIIRRQS